MWQKKSLGKFKEEQVMVRIVTDTFAFPLEGYVINVDDELLTIADVVDPGTCEVVIIPLENIKMIGEGGEGRVFDLCTSFINPDFSEDKDPAEEKVEDPAVAEAPTFDTED